METIIAGMSKRFFNNLDEWTTVELVALGQRVIEILKERKAKGEARERSLGNLIQGKESRK